MSFNFYKWRWVSYGMAEYGMVLPHICHLLHQILRPGNLMPKVYKSRTKLPRNKTAYCKQSAYIVSGMVYFDFKLCPPSD